MQGEWKKIEGEGAPKKKSNREISVEASVAGFFPKKSKFGNNRLQGACMDYIQCHGTTG